MKLNTPERTHIPMNEQNAINSRSRRHTALCGREVDRQYLRLDGGATCSQCRAVARAQMRRQARKGAR